MTGLSSEQQQPRVTIYDVARLARVSPSTVSRALNKPGRMTAETERKVREAAERLEFEINPSARALQTGRRMTLALMLADITNPVVFGVIRGAERGAAAAGYSLIIAESQESGESELKMLRKIQASVDGIVLATTRVSTQSIQQFARALPIVLVNRAESAVASIVPDVRGGVAQLLDHLQAVRAREYCLSFGPGRVLDEQRALGGTRQAGTAPEDAASSRSPAGSQRCRAARRLSSASCSPRRLP